MPLPCGLNGKRSLVPNPKAGHGAVSISSGQRPEALQHLETVMQLAGGGAGQLPLQNPAVAAAISALSVTFCASEPPPFRPLFIHGQSFRLQGSVLLVLVSLQMLLWDLELPFHRRPLYLDWRRPRVVGLQKEVLDHASLLLAQHLEAWVMLSEAPLPQEVVRLHKWPTTPMSNSGYISPPALSGRASMDHLHHRGSIGGAWMDGAPPSPTMTPQMTGVFSPTGSLPPFPLRPPSSLDSRHFEDDIQTPVTPAHYGPTPGLPTLPPFPPLPEHHHYQSDNAYHHHHHHLSRPASTTLVPSPPAISKYVGEDGGWSLWSDGTLRVGRIFVGRLPRGVTFSRGTPITVKVDMEARTVSFDVGGVDLV
ncbi:hypothetical protein BC829DRAFT_68935 [Chytridium lagenaria]|nr:hypothetical protein BC829DRAFT_68935 [Chytridium lagenaria]